MVLPTSLDSEAPTTLVPGDCAICRSLVVWCWLRGADFGFFQVLSPHTPTLPPPSPPPPLTPPPFSPACDWRQRVHRFPQDSVVLSVDQEVLLPLATACALQCRLAEGFELAWAYIPVFDLPSPVRLYTYLIDCSAWLSMTCLLPVFSPRSFSLTTFRCEFLGFCIVLRYALTCFTFCRGSIDGRSSRYRMTSRGVSAGVP